MIVLYTLIKIQHLMHITANYKLQGQNSHSEASQKYCIVQDTDQIKCHPQARQCTFLVNFNIGLQTFEKIHKKYHGFAQIATINIPIGRYTLYTIIFYHSICGKTN